MVTDEVGIYNLALNAIGARDNLSATTERDRGAEVCRLWYPVVRDQLLRAAPWPSATMFKRLALLAEKTTDNAWVDADPAPGYRYVYSLPTDFLYPRYVTDYEQFMMSSYKGTQKVINSNQPQLLLTYTGRVENIALWEPSLQMAVVYGLAAHISMPLTGKRGRSIELVQQANELALHAREEAANENNTQLSFIPDWIATRGYVNPGDSRYFYPYGPLLSITSSGA